MSKKNKGILKFFAGLIIGIGIGLSIDNIGVGIGVGIALGAGLSQGKIAWIFLNLYFPKTIICFGIFRLHKLLTRKISKKYFSKIVV